MILGRPSAAGSVDVSRAVGLCRAVRRSASTYAQLSLALASFPGWRDLQPFRFQVQLDPAADLLGLGDPVLFLESLEAHGQFGIDVEIHAVSHDTIIHDVDIYYSLDNLYRIT